MFGGGALRVVWGGVERSCSASDDEEAAGVVSPSELAWVAAVRPAVVLAAVEARLVAAGGVVELRQLQGMSRQETDVLVYREIHA